MNKPSLFRRILCFLGYHAGLCLNGSFRCSHCQYYSPYWQKNKPTTILPMNPNHIAETAAAQIRAKYLVLGAPRPSEEIAALILTAAAKMVRESKCLECGDAMAAYLAPGPVPTSEPTERDYLLADWDQAAAALRSITGEAGE